MQASYLPSLEIESIYLGGGTPSLCEPGELERILNAVHHNFKVLPDAEITMEVNPEQVQADSVKAWCQLGINRISLGVQSFFDEDLQFMNRNHSARQSVQALECLLNEGITRLSIDLIFGFPGLSDTRWQDNISRALSFGIPHISGYALTVEPRTALHHFIRQGKVADPDPEQSARQFDQLMYRLSDAGYEHYEISNYALPGFRALHNSRYWTGEPYLGIGPSAHSFNGLWRQVNVRNNSAYIKAIQSGIIPAEVEHLTEAQRFNEWILTRLRTIEGLSITEISQRLPTHHTVNWWREVKQQVQAGWLLHDNACVRLSREGKFFADQAAMKLFLE